MMARRPARHRITLEDRGPAHRHRHRARCSCGWATIPLNLKRTVIRHAAEHARARVRSGQPQPRPITPDADLPAAIRRGAA